MGSCHSANFTRFSFTLKVGKSVLSVTFVSIRAIKLLNYSARVVFNHPPPHHLENMYQSCYLISIYTRLQYCDTHSAVFARGLSSDQTTDSHSHEPDAN